ncbi:hypothetical protein [Falsibacillus pallidus]|uniref:hypothetical protein n=1 Tax=Falsibacillus pallidus TaxID=493781 RepID=UPI003D98E705
MNAPLEGTWQHASVVHRKVSYQCTHCGKVSTPRRKYKCVEPNRAGPITRGIIYICSECNRPTFIEQSAKPDQL